MGFEGRCLIVPPGYCLDGTLVWSQGGKVFDNLYLYNSFPPVMKQTSLINLFHKSRFLSSKSASEEVSQSCKPSGQPILQSRNITYLCRYLRVRVIKLGALYGGGILWSWRKRE